jgi:ornithine decarboxylase
VDYAEGQLWTCRAITEGILCASPIDRSFVAHLGEAIFRDDLDNSILAGRLADSRRAGAGGAEGGDIRRRENLFRAQWAFASNKVVLSALIAKGDLVLFDRNNHGPWRFFMAGAISRLLPTQRNCFGLIGPIDYDALEEARAARLFATTLVADSAWRRPRPAAVIDAPMMGRSMMSAFC